MTPNYPKAIREILDFKKNFQKIDRESNAPQKLVGELGEYYVLDELKRRGFMPEHKGGQGRFDILLRGIGRKIEVKTSVPKNEGVYPDKNILFWGWTVERVRTKKRKGGFDYLIGVALDENLKRPRFYIFSYKEANSVGVVNVGRFKNIRKKINLFLTKDMFSKAVQLRPKLVTPYERKINMRPELFRGKWNKIK